MDRMRQGDDPHNEEWEITRKDGKKRIIYFKASVLEVSEKNVYVLALMNDVTDRKRVEEEIPQQYRENAGTLMRGNQLQTFRNIVHCHGGKVWAEAKVNEGATFRVSIPIKGSHDEQLRWCYVY
jgi:hypothetical protein